MIKLFSLKKEGQRAEGRTGASGGRQSAAHLRINKGECRRRSLHASCVGPSVTDIQELTLPKTCAIEIPDPDDLLNFRILIAPDEVSGW